MEHRPNSFFQQGRAFGLYERIRDDPFNGDMKSGLDHLWTAFSGLEDSHFLTEAKKSHDDCQRRFWEMYLGAALRDMGMPVASNGNHGPDLTVVRGRASHVHVECVAPNSGTGRDAAPPPPTQAQLMSIGTPQDLRVLSAIKDKRDKFRKYRDEGVIDRDSPCLIAVNGGLVHGSSISFGLPRIVLLAFGLGQAEVQVPLGPGADHLGTSLVIPPRSFVTKASGTTISSSLFSDPDMGHISGLLWSDAKYNSVGLPVPFGRDLQLVINPCAINPLSRSWLPRGETFWVHRARLLRSKNRKRVQTWRP